MPTNAITNATYGYAAPVPAKPTDQLAKPEALESRPAKPVDQALISPQAKALAEAERAGAAASPNQGVGQPPAASTRAVADREQARSDERRAPERQAAGVQNGMRQAQAKIDTVV
ncbi:MAG TPA: hypothetical protein DCS97_09540 [Planctomycetes bacterium]|nr:hypothetical protein [Planctomycetota bacterium]